ncbi:hypothetical protein D3C87_2128030 [compost metagenome]
MNCEEEDEIGVGVGFAYHRRGVDILRQVTDSLAHLVTHIVGRAFQVGFQVKFYRNVA